jgi:pimeloyl-ACP methyl ester carboxylesterase
MKRWKKVLPALFIFACLVISVVPFFVPVPELSGLSAEKELADSDSKFIEVNDVTIHYKEMGKGKTAFILLHGFGASVYSWREVMDDFAQYGRVIAYDRPAFGLTERPMPETWKENPYGMGANVQLLRGLMDALEVDKAILVGNSAGGGVAVAFALEYPARVEKLVLVDPGVGGGRGPRFPGWALPLMWTPQMRHLGPLMMRRYQETLPVTISREWADETKLPESVKRKYLKTLMINNWDRAFYELTFSPAYPELRPLLPNLKVDTFIIAGEDDRLIHAWYFEEISKEIPAPLVLLSKCGHVPHEECPNRFMKEVLSFLELQ